MSKAKLITICLSLICLIGCSTQPPKIQTETIKEESDNPPYTIDVKIPTITDFKKGNVKQEVNNRIKGVISEIISKFKENVGSLHQAEGMNEFMEAFTEPASELMIDHEISLSTKSLLSVKFSVMEYYIGAAHPSTHTLVFNYSLSKNKPVELKDLFKSGSEYLSALSKLAIDDLYIQFDDRLTKRYKGWIETGAAPEAKNYQKFVLSEDSLIIYFDPYQVASYADGLRKVAIPYEKLKDIINPKGPLKPLLSIKKSK